MLENRPDEPATFDSLPLFVVTCLITIGIYLAHPQRGIVSLPLSTDIQKYFAQAFLCLSSIKLV